VGRITAAVYIGIDRCDPRMQRIIRKNARGWRGWMRCSPGSKYKVRLTFSLIVGFPDEYRADVNAAARFFLRYSSFSYNKYADTSFDTVCVDRSGQGQPGPIDL